MSNALVRDLKGVYTIWYRDLLRFFRDRSRIFGSLGMPLLFLIVFGSGFGGAWAFDQRWSIVAACAAVAGLAGWLLLGGRPAAARLVAIASGSIVAVGSLMAILNPPPFTKPALAPWIALVTGAGAAIVGLSARARPKAPHV